MNARGSDTSRSALERSARAIAVEVQRVAAADGGRASGLRRRGSRAGDGAADNAADEQAIASGSGDDWNVPGQPLFGGGAVPAGAPNDVAFLSTVISTLRADLCIDASAYTRRAFPAVRAWRSTWL
ncbi:MAG TPA: hypothetical protein VND88_03490 [Candidatus Acidoferrales bacterium]|nr:hypothetical protein [Candidatus Acidoferrales bacterium]